MKKIIYLICLVLFISLSAVVSRPLFKKRARDIKKDSRPNIIVILADDMGFSDVGCFGGEIHTPNIDYLAYHGVRYTQFYNTSRCCPTRASLLTGLYNQQAGIGKMTDAEDEPGYLGHITDNAVTIAEVLKAAGYHTAMSGKWHVANTNSQSNQQDQLAWLNHQKSFGDFAPLDQYPTSRGFEKFFGTIWGVVDYFDPFSLVDGTKPVKNVPQDYYETDAINDTAVSYIFSLSKEDKPFFLYIAENAPHWPLMAKPEDIAKYKNTYNAGWEAVREARFKRMAELGVVDTAKTKLSPRWNDTLTWENNPTKDWDAMAMTVHAAMIDRMDQGIGRIINALRKTGQLDNTLIFFLSDNGASAEICANYGPGFDRPSETRDGRKIVYATKKQSMPGAETTYSSIGPRWANVANTPYQYWKAESYEGGIHTPMIAFWPKGIKLHQGSFNGRVSHVMDFMNTFIELAKTNYPKTFKGKNIIPASGISMVPSFEGKPDRGHDTLFNEHFGAKYARVGNWKLVALGAHAKNWHLYNLSDDKSELKDLKSVHPNKVKYLDSLWKIWANSHMVFPKPRK